MKKQVKSKKSKGKSVLVLVFVIFSFLLLPFYLFFDLAHSATGCGYPATLDTFPNVSSGTILTAADYNKLLCAVEQLEANFQLRNFTATTLPATPTTGQIVYVTDALNNTTCTTGGGTTKNVCVYNGIGWAVAGGGGGGGSIDLTGTYAWTGAHSFRDANLSILNSAAPTKVLKFDAANVPAGTTVTLGVPGVNTTLLGVNTFAALATGVVKSTTTTGALSTGTVAIAEGGTGATTQAAAQTNLAIVPGTNVFIQRTFQDHANVLTWTNGNGVAGNPTPRIDNTMVDGSSHFAADSGSSDDYAACPRSISTMSTPAYVDQSVHGFRANTANIGAATINYCSLGARALVKLVGGINVPLATGDILVGQPVLTVFHASNNQFQILSTLASGAGGGGTGTPAGPANSCQYNAAGILGGDAGCTFDPTTDLLSVAGGVIAGNATTNSVKYGMGGSISGAKNYTANRNIDADVAVTVGTLTSGDNSKFDANGALVRGGTANKVFQFMLGAEDGSALLDTNDQPTIFYNHYGQGLTINSVFCESDAGTPTINLARDDGSPANILSASLSCSTSGATSTSFSGTENLIASTNRVDLVLVSAGGTAKRIMVSVRYTLD